MHVDGKRSNGAGEEHPSRVLDVLLDPHKESDRFPAVQQSMIVR